ncbi:MAG: AMP-binding protein [Myxococcales bacterium]|nr:AMP-binding protein [Myxococcales bacterium]
MAEPDQSPPDDLARVLEIVRGVVLDVSDGRGLGALGPNVSFERELGLGSLERVELAVRVSKAFGRELSDEEIAVADTPRQLLAFLEAKRGASTSARAPAAAPADPTELLPREPPAPEPSDAATLVDVLEYHLRQQPERVHIVLLEDDGTPRPITYRALHRAAAEVARTLRQHGLRPGRSVAIMLPTGMGYFASFMGTLLAGGVPVPLYPPVRLDRIAEYIERCAKILDNAQAQVLVTFDRAARVADIARDRVACIEHVLSVDALSLHDAGASEAAVRAPVVAEDTALIQYTSGSTGDPKGVELTQANVMANIRAAREGCALSARDVLVSWLPLYHDMGLIGGWLMPLYFGVPTVLMSPMAFLSRPERWLRAMTDYRATCSVAPNFAFDLCVKRIDDDTRAELHLGQVRAVLNGSEPILPATLDRFAERFGPAGFRRDALFCAYGLAENMVAVTFPRPGQPPRIDRIRRTTFEQEGRAEPAADEDDALEFVGVGSAVPRHEVQVVDEDGQPVPERRQGVVWFRGPSSFKGYYRRPDATAEVQREGGWVDTGDLGYLADGELFITGRIKDLIIKGGRNYYPHELEAAAGAVPGIRLGCVAAFAVPDAAAGTERIVVVAETREQDERAREVLVARVIETITTTVGVPPDQVVLARPGAVPKTSSGKIRRRDCRRSYLEGTLEQGHGSVARQAAGLALRSAPARIGAALRGAARAIYGAYAIATIVGWCLLASLVGRLVPAGGPSRRVARLEARIAMTMVGLRPRVEGLERLPPDGRGAILVANHAGYLDFLICVVALPTDTRFVIKSELRSNALVGPLLRKLGHVYIDRHSTARSLSDLEEVRTLLQGGQRVLLFPEGTFYPEVGMRPFKLGAFRLAAQAEVPVVPVAIRGSRRALRDGTWLPRHERLEVEVLPSLRAAGEQMPEVVSLRDRSADAIAQRIDEPRLFAADIAVPGAPARAGGDAP